MTSSHKTSFKQKMRLFLLSAVAIAIASCGGQTASNGNARVNANPTSANTNAANNTASSDDTAALAAQILLPIVPEEVKWREETVRNPEGKKLIAVLKYREEDAKKLIEQAGKHRPSEPVEIAAEDWFPEELVAQSQLAGDDSLKGNAYAANDFLQLPYKTGRLVKIDNSNYFVLELTTN